MEANRIDDLAFFSTVAGAPSLTAAGRDLGMSLPAVSRRLAKLEQRLGVRLARRTTRRLDLTAEGRLFDQRALEILRDVDDLEDLVTHQSGALKGELNVQSTLGFGRHHVAPLLAGFLRDHPDLHGGLDLSPLPWSTAGAQFDVGVRVGRPPESQLSTVFLAANHRMVCASPAYLQVQGHPTTPEELAGHNCIILRENDYDYALWRFAEDGKNRNVRVSGTLASNDGETATGWALAGYGLILRSSWQVRKHLDDGSLVEVLQDFATPETDIYATYAATAHTPRRVTAFVDYLKQEIPQRLAAACDQNPQ